jgi:hypothetical protein
VLHDLPARCGGLQELEDCRDVTGFLPGWLAVVGLICSGAMTAAVIAARCSVPLWLLPLAVLLAAGTWS